MLTNINYLKFSIFQLSFDNKGSTLLRRTIAYLQRERHLAVVTQRAHGESIRGVLVIRRKGCILRVEQPIQITFKISK